MKKIKPINNDYNLKERWVFSSPTPNLLIYIVFSVLFVITQNNVGAFTFDRDDEFGLKVNETRLAFFTPVEKKGRIRSLVHTNPFLSFTASERPLFIIRMTDPANTGYPSNPSYTKSKAINFEQGIEITSDEFATFSHTVISSEDKVTLTYRDHPTWNISVDVVWQIQGNELRTTIAVTNNTNRAIFSVLYPYFASKAPLNADVNDDYILWPAQPAEGSLVKGPANFTVMQAASYPRDAFAQVTAYYGPTAGYVMYCRDTAGEFKIFG